MPRVLPLILLAALAGCDKLTPSPTVPIVYRVGGTAASANLTFSVNDATLQESNISPPWEKPFSTRTKDEFLYLSAQNNTRDGCVSVEIVRDGKSFRSGQSCGAFVIATVNALANEK